MPPLVAVLRASLLVALTTAAWGFRADAQEPALSVRITSPLGRTGLPGPIRIVAQVRHTPTVPPGEVRFFVDHQLLRSVAEGPPYAVEWLDENPFERREIAVEVVDVRGNAARDAVVLEPLEIVEAALVTSVLLEASVQDAGGRFVKGLGATAFTVLEDGVPQILDIVRQEDVGATFALLVDASSSMSRRMDFVHRTAATLAGYLSPLDRMLIAPFTRTLGATTGPTEDRATIVEAIEAIRPAGGTAILDALVHLSGSLASTEGRRAIVLITDGYDEHSETSFEEALEAVKAAHATVYVVGIGGVAGISIRGERLLRRIATETGGRFFFPAREQQLGHVHDVLTEDVQNRYLITYTPGNQKVDGTWRAIAVETADPDYVVHTRAGYFAPSPPPIRPAVEFTATSPGGDYLDVSIDDLEVVEDGVPQTVESFHESVTPVSIVLALDASGSMRRAAPLLMEAARDFVDSLRPDDRLALVLFADRSRFAHDLSTNRDFSYQAIDEYRALGGTALYDALSDALIRLRRVDGRRVVVVMTDGRDEDNPGTGPGSVRRFEDVLRHQKETAATIFTIALGPEIDPEPLQHLADISGGQAFFPVAGEDLRGEFQQVAEDLRRRWVVGYTSSNSARDGAWRQVEIRLRATEAEIRSVGGYFAPGQ